MKKVFIILLIPALIILCSGCGNYIEINRLDIVTGIAIDKTGDNSEYKLTFEIFNVAKADSEGTVDTTYTESTGKTLFEAVRNAKKQLVNRLFFGATQALIISRQIAEKEGLLPIIEGFIRDNEPRETLVITVSQESSAVDVLKSTSPDSAVLSFAIKKVVMDDAKLTGATIGVELYKTYSEIYQPGTSVTLPLLKTLGEKEKILEVAGVAVFEKDKMKGEISAENAKYFLMLKDKLDGGVLNFKTDDTGPYDSSAEIKESKTSFKYSETNGNLNISLSVETKIDIVEYPSGESFLVDAVRRKVEKQLETIIKSGLEEMISIAKNEFGQEIFGLGSRVEKSDPKKWKIYKEKWNELFQNANFEIKTDVEIINTGFLRKY